MKPYDNPVVYIPPDGVGVYTEITFAGWMFSILISFPVLAWNLPLDRGETSTPGKEGTSMEEARRQRLTARRKFQVYLETLQPRWTRAS